MAAGMVEVVVTVTVVDVVGVVVVAMVRYRSRSRPIQRRTPRAENPSLNLNRNPIWLSIVCSGIFQMLCNSV